MTPARARSRLYATLQALDLRLGAIHLEDGDGPGDAADQHALVQAREDATGERARLAEQRRHVVAALIRIEEKSWGQCIDCQDDIAPARLEAIPWASRCVACEARHESETRASTPVLDVRPPDYADGEEDS